MAWQQRRCAAACRNHYLAWFRLRGFRFTRNPSPEHRPLASGNPNPFRDAPIRRLAFGAQFWDARRQPVRSSRRARVQKRRARHFEGSAHAASLPFALVGPTPSLDVREELGNAKGGVLV